MASIMNKSIRAYLDYPVALALMAMPTIRGLGATNPLAFWLSTVIGATVLVVVTFDRTDTAAVGA